MLVVLPSFQADLLEAFSDIFGILLEVRYRAAWLLV